MKERDLSLRETQVWATDEENTQQKLEFVKWSKAYQGSHNRQFQEPIYMIECRKYHK